MSAYNDDHGGAVSMFSIGDQDKGRCFPWNGRKDLSEAWEQLWPSGHWPSWC